MSCEVEQNCFEWGRSCWHCKFAGEGADNCYSPIDRSIKHPQTVAARDKRKADEKAAKEAHKKNKNKDKVELLKKAARAENRVHKTLNSGRVNQDGDLKTEDLCLDVKLQTTTINPVIHVDEFKKCQGDATRAGKRHGVLIIENSEGDRFYVISEELFMETFI